MLNKNTKIFGNHNKEFISSNTRVIALQQGFISSIGLEATVLLSQAIYWQKKMGNKSWYKTQQDWKTEIGLSRRQQERARSVLRDFKPQFWHEEYAGTPRRLYFKVDLSVFTNTTLLNKQASTDIANLPVTTELASMSASGMHNSRVKQKIKAGDFSNAASGIDSFLSRHIHKEGYNNG